MLAFRAVILREDFAASGGLLLEFLLPQYVEEGKHSLTVAVGCTGGRHRSVAVADALCSAVRAKGGDAQLVNRDIEK